MAGNIRTRTGNVCWPILLSASVTAACSGGPGPTAAKTTAAAVGDTGVVSDVAAAVDALAGAEAAPPAGSETAPETTTGQDVAPIEVAPPACVTASDCGLPPGCLLVVCTAKGHCATAPQADGAPCDDGNACTTGDTCSAGNCAAAGPVLCEDANPCSKDSCNPIVGCLNVPIAVTATCDDGDSCTVGDTNAFNTIKCNDNNPCTSGDVCNGGKCAPTGLILCDDAKLCTSDSCDPKAGCVFANNAKSCDDADPCTPAASCTGGLCIGGTPKSCDDKNQCTTDACNPKTGACVNALTTDSCSDGNACTAFDQCGSGKCVGKELTCDDGNGCTADSCDIALGCTATNTTAPCDLGNCKQDDACSGGVCKAGVVNSFFSTTAPLIGDQYPLRLRFNALQATLGGGYLMVGSKNAGSGPSGVRFGIDGTGKQSLLLVDADLPQSLGRVANQLQMTSNTTGGKQSLGVALDESGKALGQPVDTGLLETRAILDLASTALYAGTTLDVSSQNHLGAARFKADGSLAWSWTGDADTTGTSGAVGNNLQSAIVVGFGALKVGKGQDLHFALVAADGTPIATGSLGGIDNDLATDATAVGTSGFVVVGSTASTGAGNADGWLVRLDGTGKVLWQRTFGGSLADGFNSVVATTDGFVLAGWTSSSGAGGTDNWLVGTDWYGNVRWERVFGSAANDAIDNLALGSKGAVVGTSTDAGTTVWRRDRWGFGSCGAAGICKTLTGNDCDDGNPCTIDTCSPTAGCKSTPMAAGSLCADDSQCNAAGKCSVPIGMVEIAAGKFWMGCAAVDVTCLDQEKPLHEVILSAYAIDKNEVTVDQFAQCVASNGCLVPALWSQTAPAYNYGAPDRGLHPVNCILQSQAKAYCAWSGKRLPTEAEWEKAARGGCEKFANPDCKAAATMYPWGNNAVGCNLATYYTSNTSNAGCGTGTTSAVGSKPAGASPYGVYDLLGNVAEWTNDNFSASYYIDSPTQDPPGSPVDFGYYPLRGGGFSLFAGSLRNSARDGANGGLGPEYAGFRCAVSLK